MAELEINKHRIVQGGSGGKLLWCPSADLMFKREQVKDARCPYCQAQLKLG